MTLGQKKQILYGGAFLFVIALVLFFLISAIVPNPTCFDGKKNQGELGIDCDGPCGPCKVPIEKLNIDLIKYFKIENGIYDSVARVRNLNFIYGASKIDYEFVFYNNQGEKIASRQGKSFIMPSDSRYIIESAIKINADVARVDFEIKDIGWKEVADSIEVKLPIINKLYQKETNFIFSKISGIVINDNNFNFNDIEVSAVLENKSGNILAVNKTLLNSLFSHERRPFEMRWFKPFDGEADTVIIEAKTNALISENFYR